MKLAAIFAKTWFSASFPKKIVSRKSGPAPETKIAFFGFFYSQKQKKRGAPTGIPAQPRPEAPSHWDGHRKSNTFFHQPYPFSVFSSSFFMENNPTEPKTSPHSPPPTKNNKSIVFRHKKPSTSPKQATGKTIPENEAGLYIWNPYPKAHPPFHFSKIDAE